VSRFVLDTDHFSLLQHKHPIVLQRVVARAPGELAITVITAEEQLRGWLAVIRQHAQTDRQIWAYQGLQETLRGFNRFTLLPFEHAANDQLVRLRQQRLRIGSQDLRIAAIVLNLGATLVTRNQRDFGQVPGLAIEDWTLPVPP
jgi:tRNA(fMet)-specific endonuclease VapC